MFKVLILILCITKFAFSKEIEIEDKWKEFKTNFYKTYNSFKEEQYRKQIWIKNLKYLESFELLNPNSTFKVQINELSDRETCVS
jgi:hypothetical protein